jgi:hypothetical protein
MTFVPSHWVPGVRLAISLITARARSGRLEAHEFGRAGRSRDPDSGRQRRVSRDLCGPVADAVYVLHCFQKKAEKTSKPDLDLASKRYRDLLKELGQ